ncbi:MAG: tRNA preQ1(34) S-adenosylmethionine ribosyltransferase-isomerase QueA [Chitinispirillales bacterium]|jgi:S-adenosylmethionine:tRNA ribosyltransferase-isomerase|nr:tRNA preQ1(34) S-adenosylmethionine ribosyltransferase-isomerase QueA [Chitinispirillales bacterium]
MRTTDFDYELPPELIAKRPIAERDGCRLLWVRRDGDCGISADSINSTDNSPFRHLTFRDILTILKPGDRLVFNDTRVIPARLFCTKVDTGAAIELFFTERAGEDGRSWKALVKPAKRAPVGTVLSVDGDPRIKIRIDEVMGDGYERIVSLVSSPDYGINNTNCNNNYHTDPANDTNHINGIDNNRDRDVCIDTDQPRTLDAVIDAHGRIPLPHYMERDGDEVDDEMYQTVYAGRPGAVAAPTAGLHFTPKLLDELAAMGVDRSFVTLHVGVGTFRPVQTDDPREHDIHDERFELSGQAAGEINATWGRGGRVIAVGTTVVRVLESCAASARQVAPASGRTKLMILPPYQFRAVDGLITNFHLPKSTLLMLVSAFAARETILSAYREAVGLGYRFFSYGDAMAII